MQRLELDSWISKRLLFYKNSFFCSSIKGTPEHSQGCFHFSVFSFLLLLAVLLILYSVSTFNYVKAFYLVPHLFIAEINFILPWRIRLNRKTAHYLTGNLFSDPVLLQALLYLLIYSLNRYSLNISYILGTLSATSNNT